MAARLEDVEYPFGDPIYFGFAEYGDSNLIEYGSNRIARSWSLAYLDRDYQFMKRVVSGAAECEGGMLRCSHARYTKPESYIANWRKAMSEAAPLSEYLRFAGLSLRFHSWDRMLREKAQQSRDDGFVQAAERVDALVSRLAEASAVEETVETFCGDAYPVTAVEITASNHDSVIELVHRVLRERSEGLSVWRSEFSEWGYARAQSSLPAKRAN
jgi:hypothetical protein